MAAILQGSIVGATCSRRLDATARIPVACTIKAVRS